MFGAAGVLAVILGSFFLREHRFEIHLHSFILHVSNRRYEHPDDPDECARIQRQSSKGLV